MLRRPAGRRRCALHLDSLNGDQLRELDELHRTTGEVQVCTRAQMIQLAAEQSPTISKVAAVVRESGETVLRWVRRYKAKGLDGLSDAPRSGKPAKAGPAYRERLVELGDHFEGRSSAWSLFG